MEITVGGRGRKPRGTASEGTAPPSPRIHVNVRVQIHIPKYTYIYMHVMKRLLGSVPEG